MDLPDVTAKARLYDLQSEVTTQADRTRAAAEAARKTSEAWLAARRDGFELFNLTQGIDRVQTALDALKTELRRLQALLNEQCELMKGV